MTKRIVCILLSMLICMLMIGCNKNANTSNTEVTTMEQMTMEDAGQIVVNGHNITNGQYYRYKYSGKQSEIPLLAVFEELGAKVKWVNQNKVKITYDGKVMNIDTTKDHFNIFAPPGTYNAVREVRGKELVVDIFSVKGVIASMTGATVRFDDNTQTVYIENKTQGTVSVKTGPGNTGDGS